MTIAELNRYIESWQRRTKREAQERAAHNYILAGLVGRSIASYFSEEIEMPKVEEVYSSLFEDKAEVTKQQKETLKTELSALRLKQFATFHNEKYKVVEKINDE